MWPLRQKVLLTQRRPFVVLFNKLPVFLPWGWAAQEHECLRWKRRGWEITNQPPQKVSPREPEDPGAPDSGVITCRSLTFSTQEQQNHASRRELPSPKPPLWICQSWLELYWAWIKSNSRSGDMKTRPEDMFPNTFSITHAFLQKNMWAHFLQKPAAKQINHASNCNYLLNRSG